MATAVKEAPKKVGKKKEVEVSLKSKRFVVRQSLIGKNTVIE